MMSTIVNSISKRINDDEDNWDRFIPFIQYSYNNTPCLDSTEYTPFFLTHGRYPRSLLDISFDNFDLPVTCRDYIIRLLENLDKSREVAVEILKERKQQMVTTANRKTHELQFAVGDIVYIYRPVVTPGKHRKFMRPWIGPYYITQKLSDIHVKIRRKSDGKLVKNRVHVNRLKHGFLWHDRPQDPEAPPNVDATEPAILADEEIPPNFVDNTEIPQGVDNVSQNGDPQNDSISEKLYEVEKILRKKFVDGKWYYRVKWLDFDSTNNSWVEYQDLNEKCKKYVNDMHKKILTDRRSKKKN
ncbi:uncharacterized protein LOC134692615 [Mytilus trossulus]|uniref:uncharacterized protein LOC134692615 n=1 Tax=Mytilus trossulus TaxID=6551 RepID=UPI003005E1AD